MNKLCVSSLVVQADPADLQQVRSRIASIADAEIMGENEQGKLVVVLDTKNNHTAADRISEIQNTDGVLSAPLVYQYDDHEPQVEESA